MADVETVALELILADLETVERNQEKTKAAAKARPADFESQLNALEALHKHLDKGLPARTLAVPATELEFVRQLNLLTAKPVLYVANVGESDLPEGGPLLKPLRAQAAKEGTECVAICAQCEAELADWPVDDAMAYLQELGLAKPGLDRFIQAGYRLLNLITFFTTTGGKEVRAWPITQGTTVVDAAGQIHTDMQRGFIRAEVVSYDGLMETGSVAAARDKGLLRMEGRDYLVQDGDIVHIRFNV